jgi:hypothetical protein
VAIDTTYFASDLAAMVADLPCAAKFGSDEFNCAASELSAEEALVLCGDIPKKAIRVFFRSNAFTVGATFKAQARMQLKFPNVAAFSNYEIVSIATSPDSVGYEVILKADNRA